MPGLICSHFKFWKIYSHMIYSRYIWWLISLSRFLRSVSQFGLRDPGFQQNVSICEVEWLQKWVAAKMNSKNDLAKAATWMRRHRWHLKWYFHIRMWMWYIIYIYIYIFACHIHQFFQFTVIPVWSIYCKFLWTQTSWRQNLRSSRGGGVPWSQRSSGSCSFCIARGLWREECTTGDLFSVCFGGFGCL